MPDEDVAGPVARLMAFVVAPGLTPADLDLALRSRIDPAFLPRPLYFVDSLPRLPTGKLPLATLKAWISDLSQGASRGRA
jgi:acyl-coenzyme A synthetase/AMP-(fatty) acid ligase